MTGGLGPTKDDRTKQALCDYFGGKLIVDNAVLEHVRTIFSRLKRPMLDSNMRQDEVPDNCTVLFNKEGTAPGMWFHRKGRIYVSLPDVQYYMMALMNEQILPQPAAYFREQQTQN